MSLECAVFEAEWYVELSENLVLSPGTEFCIECGQLIPHGEEHYHAREWEISNGLSRTGETEKGQQCCCEECGDLALSWMELGYCWSYGDLRADIAELNQEVFG